MPYEHLWTILGFFYLTKITFPFQEVPLQSTKLGEYAMISVVLHRAFCDLFECYILSAGFYMSIL